MIKYMKKIINNPKFIAILYIALILIFGLIYWATPSFWKTELTLIQSLYFSVVTITTLGYGDITPQNDIAMIFTALESLSGILVIGLFLNALAQTYSSKESERFRNREDEQWKPARLMVARHVCRVHQLIFGSFRYIVDVNSHVDLNGAGVAPGMKQRDADAYVKEHAAKLLEKPYNELKKMVEYNNVALDSVLQPKIITFLVAAGELLNTCNFVVLAYKDKKGSGFGGSFNYDDAKNMYAIYEEFLALYPEILELEKYTGPTLSTAEELYELVKESNSKCVFLDLNISH
jgi:hypothetical protein